VLVPLTAACIAAAAAMFQVPETLLWTILKTEGGRVGACEPQSNHTHDCGPAQINAETWVPRLALALHRPSDEVRSSIRDDGCFNVWVAGYVLRANIRMVKGNVWDAAGRYNSATPTYKLAYQAKLLDNYDSLFVRRRR